MNKIIVLLWLFVMLLKTGVNAQICISHDGSQPDNSAMLELKSDSLGFLPPRMKAVEKYNISNPKPGMIIYNTTTHSLDFLTSKTSNGRPHWTSIDENGIRKTPAIFQVIYGDTMNDYFKDIIQTSDGGYLAVGTIEKYDTRYIGNSFYYLTALKLKSDGTPDENFNAYGGDYGNFATHYHNYADGNDYYADKPTKGETVIETENGNYVLGGYFFNASGAGSNTGDFYAVKLTSNGSLDFGGFGPYGHIGFGALGTSEDQGRCICETFDGGFIFCGMSSNHSYGGGAENAQIVKLTNYGDLDNTFNSGEGNIVFSTDAKDIFEAVIQTSDSSYFAVGQSNVKYLFVVKLKPDGTLDPSFNGNGRLNLADTTIEGDIYRDIYASDLKETPDGKLLICGDCAHVPGQYSIRNAFVLRITKTGTIDTTFANKGTAVFGAPNNANYSTYAYSIDVTRDSGFVIAGRINSYIWNGNETNNCNAFVAKYLKNGTLDSTFAYNGKIVIGTDTTKDIASSVHQTREGGYIIAGSTTMMQSNGNSSGFIAKISPNGEVCANGKDAGVPHSGIFLKILTSQTTITHGGIIINSTPVNVHKGSLSTACNQQ